MREEACLLNGEAMKSVRLCNPRLEKGEARCADTSLCAVEVDMTFAELIANGLEQ